MQSQIAEILNNPKPPPERTKLGQMLVEVCRDSETEARIVFRFKRGETPPPIRAVEYMLSGIGQHCGYRVDSIEYVKTLTIATIKKRRLNSEN